MDEFEKLWELVQLIHPSSPLPAATLQLELDQYRGKLLKLFQNKVGWGGSRATQGRQVLRQAAQSRSVGRSRASSSSSLTSMQHTAKLWLV